jgi:glycosyltransferase involved in cell wall biosynthesis
VRHEETGLLSKTADDLARDLARLIAEPALAARLGTAARAHVERTFNQAAVVDRTLALYTDLVRRKQQRASHA